MLPSGLVVLGAAVGHPAGADASAAAGDLRPVVTGVLLLLAMAACAKLLSTAANVLSTLIDLMRTLLRALVLAAVAALVVLAVLILAIADLLATGTG